MTVWMYAATGGHTEIVSLLRKAGAIEPAIN